MKREIVTAPNPYRVGNIHIDIMYRDTDRQRWTKKHPTDSNLYDQRVPLNLFLSVYTIPRMLNFHILMVKARVWSRETLKSSGGGWSLKMFPQE